MASALVGLVDVALAERDEALICAAVVYLSRPDDRPSRVLGDDRCARVLAHMREGSPLAALARQLPGATLDEVTAALRPTIERMLPQIVSLGTANMQPRGAS